MDRRDALNELKAKLGDLDTYLKGRGIDTGPSGKKHFKCLNPDHQDSTPSMQNLGQNVFCHGCKATYDIIDLMAADRGMKPGEFIEWGYEHYNIPLAGPREETRPPAEPKPAPPAPDKDYSAYIDACHARISQLDYKDLRGLSISVINRFKLGYDPAWKARGGRGTWKALIIPVGIHAFKVRNLDPGAEKGHRYDGSTGAHPIFNEAALTGDAPVFVTEGEIDALSIITAGGEAIALGGSGKGRLLQLLQKQRPAKPLILALDRDATGRNTEADLAAALGDIPFLQADLTGDYNDANEALNSAGSVDFIKAVRTTIDSIKTEAEHAQEIERDNYKGITAAANLDRFLEYIKIGREVYPTGLPILDEQLKGGLYEGLTIIGAVTSAGKTTVTMQMADNMAKAGRDVLIFSLETSRRELMARSISRETQIASFKARMKTEGGMPFHSIMDGQKGVMLEPAITAYREYAGRLYIFESLGKIGTKRIWDEVGRHKQITGNSPVIFIDYLQLLGPNDKTFQGVKEIMDDAVTDLKNLSDHYQTPVVLISSFNRDNYKTDANLASFKESGGIEYSADLLLGLQYEAAGSKGWSQDKLEEAAQQNPRKMVMKIMKNRNGPWGQRITMDYYSPVNLFRETGVKRNDKA